MGFRAVVHWLPFDPHLRLAGRGSSGVLHLISRAEALELLSAAGASPKVLAYLSDGEPRSSWTPVSWSPTARRTTSDARRQHARSSGTVLACRPRYPRSPAGGPYDRSAARGWRARTDPRPAPRGQQRGPDGRRAEGRHRPPVQAHHPHRAVCETTLAVQADGETRVLRRTTDDAVRSIKGQGPRTADTSIP